MCLRNIWMTLYRHFMENKCGITLMHAQVTFMLALLMIVIILKIAKFLHKVCDIFYWFDILMGESKHFFKRKNFKENFQCKVDSKSFYFFCLLDYQCDINWKVSPEKLLEQRLCTVLITVFPHIVSALE